ncbi:MAG: type II secretion system ATPase GspE [Nitrospinota bacterium]
MSNDPLSPDSPSPDDEGAANDESENSENLESLAAQLMIPLLDSIDVNEIDQDLIKLTPYQFAMSNLALPIYKEEGKVVIVTSDPSLIQSVANDLKLIYKLPLKLLMTPRAVLVKAINQAYDLYAHKASEIVDDLNVKDGNLSQLVSELPEDLLGSSVQAPVIRLVNSILVEAVKDKASDIHIEPYERELVVRLRIDGVLRNVVKPPLKLMPLILSRVKIMAGLDIAEKRLPQDGRVKIVVAGKDVDIRVSSIPTSYGERIVMRILDKSSMFIGFNSIGMGGDIKERFSKLIRSSYGIVLVAGPTGSGKTTTLYAALSHINRPELNVITIEDPVEYQLRGIGQIQVNSKIGLTFASGLRSILRQDPDVIMIGEIRDQETAQIAAQASLTGHLVFSTIHTNDATGAVARLIDMGIEPFLIASSLIGTLAQRLVRTLCNECKIERVASYTDLLKLGLEEEEIAIYKLDGLIKNKKAYSPNGCLKCSNSGYKGRTGLYELFLIDEEARSQIVRNTDSVSMRKSALGRGLMPMRVQGAAAVCNGITSMEEVVRVTADI